MNTLQSSAAINVDSSVKSTTLLNISEKTQHYNLGTSTYQEKEANSTIKKQSLRLSTIKCRENEWRPSLPVKDYKLNVLNVETKADMQATKSLEVTQSPRKSNAKDDRDKKSSLNAKIQKYKENASMSVTDVETKVAIQPIISPSAKEGSGVNTIKNSKQRPNLAMIEDEEKVLLSVANVETKVAVQATKSPKGVDQSPSQNNLKYKKECENISSNGITCETDSPKMQTTNANQDVTPEEGKENVPVGAISEDQAETIKDDGDDNNLEDENLNIGESRGRGRGMGRGRTRAYWLWVPAGSYRRGRSSFGRGFSRRGFRGRGAEANQFNAQSTYYSYHD